MGWYGICLPDPILAWDGIFVGYSIPWDPIPSHSMMARMVIRMWLPIWLQRASNMAPNMIPLQPAIWLQQRRALDLLLGECCCSHIGSYIGSHIGMGYPAQSRTHLSCVGWDLPPSQSQIKYSYENKYKISYSKYIRQESSRYIR